MAYEFTFTPRFQKHFKGLTAQEKKQLKNKPELLAQNPSPRRFVPSGFRAPQIFSSAAAIFSPVPLINSLPKLICMLSDFRCPDRSDKASGHTAASVHLTAETLT